MHWTHVMLHHSASGPNLTVAELDAEHKARGWREIGYHYVLQRGADGHGYLKAGRPDTLPGAHAGVTPWNNCALGLCVIGYFHPGAALSEHMTETLYADLLAAVRHLLAKYAIPPAHVLGHRDVRPTACPGDWFPLARVKADVNK